MHFCHFLFFFPFSLSFYSLDFYIYFIPLSPRCVCAFLSCSSLSLLYSHYIQRSNGTEHATLVPFPLTPKMPDRIDGSLWVALGRFGRFGEGFRPVSACVFPLATTWQTLRRQYVIWESTPDGALLSCQQPGFSFSVFCTLFIMVPFGHYRFHCHH